MSRLVLVACEESQRVTIALRNKGIKAWSCDILECSGGHPEWHIKGDVKKWLNDGWDDIIAFPPCTYLTVTGNKWYNIEKYGKKALERIMKREEAINFFLEIANSKCERLAIENPIGIMSTVYKKPDQIIQPYQFGHPERKATCLWLKGFSKLKPTEIVEPIIIRHKSGKTDNPWHYNTLNLNPDDRRRIRSKTYIGIANAIADQWYHP